MLSKRITAKSRELKPASHARKRMVKDRRDCHPAGWVNPPDRPPPPHAAGLLARPLPDTEPPEFRLALCLQSEAARCSAMFYPRSDALLDRSGKAPTQHTPLPPELPTAPPFTVRSRFQHKAFISTEIYYNSVHCQNAMLTGSYRVGLRGGTTPCIRKSS